MTYEEFEWHILRLVYDEGLERIQPAYIAYALGIPHETASDYLERAVESGVLEMEVTTEGRLEYFVPGAESEAQMPVPIWKEKKTDPPEGAEVSPEEETSPEPVRGREGPGHGELAVADSPADQGGESVGQPSAPSDREGGRANRSPADQPSGFDDSAGMVRAGEAAGESAPSQRADRGAAEEGPDGSVAEPGGVPEVAQREPELPGELRAHIEQREEQADGTLERASRTAGAVVDRDATVGSDRQPPVIQALEESDRELPIRIESTEETFSDPSQTIFMRQLRVHGVESEAALREHVHRLFDSMGYQIVDSDEQRMRFERGSVTFILALVPLFVLVLPLFVYLFLYCMGRSTIHQEPLELDVQLRKNQERDDVYDIDLTFIGLHGVVLGTADQRVLDEEVDTLRDELRWALTTG